MTARFDFAAAAEKARRMTDDEIHYALLDIRKTLPAADAFDREDGGDRGGRYRDEASVLYAERRARRGPRDPVTLMRRYVTGAIERGEAEPIVEVRFPDVNPSGQPALRVHRDASE